jgi:hypothetical protein
MERSAARRRRCFCHVPAGDDCRHASGQCGNGHSVPILELRERANQFGRELALRGQGRLNRLGLE